MSTIEQMKRMDEALGTMREAKTDIEKMEAVNKAMTVLIDNGDVLAFFGLMRKKTLEEGIDQGNVVGWRWGFVCGLLVAAAVFLIAVILR